MKTLTFLIGFIIITSTSFSQILFFGGKTTLATTWLYNKHVSDDEDQQYELSLGYNYGVMGGIRSNKNFGIEVDLIFNHHTQKYEGMNYESTIFLKTFDVPVMLMFGGATYFEIGPVFSMINSGEFDWDGSLLTYDSDVLDHFETTNICIAAGIGNDLELSEYFFVNVDMRFIYGLSDIDGINAYGFPQNLLLPDEQDKFHTHTIAFGLSIGLKLQF